MDEDTVDELNALNGQVIATQILLAQLMQKLVAHDPSVRSDIKAAFDSAEDMLTETAVMLGSKVSPTHTTNALKTLAQLRTIVKP